MMVKQEQTTPSEKLQKKDDDANNYKIRVNSSFLCLSLTVPMMIAFLVGMAARTLLLNNDNDISTIMMPAMTMSTTSTSSSNNKNALPVPTLLEGKEYPSTLYTAKNFDTSASATANSLYLQRSSSNNADHVVDVNVDNNDSNDDAFCTDEKQCSTTINATTNVDTLLTSSNTNDDHDDDEHLPAGQHLIIDIEHVEQDFLNSESRLAQAMVDVVNLSKLTLLSYHCHSLLPMGVSCVGVLLESHISFHTWPKEGVITLDLFTCGSGKLIPTLPIIERLFAIPRGIIGSSSNGVKKPHMVWSHKLRGFRNDDYSDFLDSELGRNPLGQMNYDLKEEIVSLQTKYQHIDVYDQVNSRKQDYNSYLRSINDDDDDDDDDADNDTSTSPPSSYESKHPDQFKPNRVVYLDGVMQSNLHGLEAYHEALVHPAMFAHPDPKRVAIIGGGEGTTLREVLKHYSVEKVKMIEIDEEMVQTSRDALPQWSDCSDIVVESAAGAATASTTSGWCGDDERAEIYYEDALAWFINRFSLDSKVKDEEEFKEEPFDVLIMDALDPQDDVPFAEVLYKNDVFLQTLYNSLSDDGIIVLQLGIAPKSKDPPEDFSKNSRRDLLTRSLVNIGFKSIHMYDEGACGFEDPWSYLIAMKNPDQRALWYRNVAEIDYAVYDRILPTHSGEPGVKFFDGPTMKSYQIPSKTYEDVYCKKIPTPKSCFTLTLKQGVKDVHIDNLEVKRSTEGDHSGRGVFTKVDISKGSTIAAKENTQAMYFSPSTTSVVWNINKYSKPVTNYMDGYGWSSSAKGLYAYYVDSHILTFSNHGCNGSSNYYTYTEMMLKKEQLGDVTEQTFDSTHVESFQVKDLYDPYTARHLPHENGLVVMWAGRDIKAGEELFDNYIYHGDTDLAYAQYLKKLCDNEVIGEITASEQQ